MILRRNLPKHSLVFAGWIIFLLSMYLPATVSNGGLIDAGHQVRGGWTVFLSWLAIASIFDGLSLTDKETFDILGFAVLGVANLLMLVAPALLILRGKWAFFMRGAMIVGALYVCTIGFLLMRDFQLLYGHYIWCLSFIIAAIGFSNRTETLP